MNEPATFGGEIGPVEGDFATHNPCVLPFRAGGNDDGFPVAVRKTAAGPGGAAPVGVGDQFGIT